MEIIAYIILILVLFLLLGMIWFKVITAFPVGFFAIIYVLIIGLLFIKVLKDRINNKEDEHYDKTVFK